MSINSVSLSLYRLTARLHEKKLVPYVINLDAVVNTLPYPANIDIRDTVKYKEVMREYGLGPNGAIMTCLNLMCTRFEQVSFKIVIFNAVEWMVMDTASKYLHSPPSSL